VDVCISSESSEYKFRCDLNDTWIASGTADHAECAGGGDVIFREVDVRQVEEVEEVCPELGPETLPIANCLRSEKLIITSHLTRID
jgi:hypothetical protein